MHDLLLTLVGAGDEFVEPKAFGFISPGVAVALAMVVVLLIMWRIGVPAMVAAALDQRIADIKKQLDEAKQLRAEAEALKAEYEKKAKAADGELAELKASAEKQAKDIVAKAKVDAKNMVERRKQMAEEKIAAAERAAIDELRDRAAKAAAEAARGLIVDKLGADADSKLVDETIKNI